MKLVIRLVASCAVLAAVGACNTGALPTSTPSGSGQGDRLATATVPEAAATALEAVGWTIASVLPVAKLEAIVEGSAPIPTCPKFDVALAANGLALTLDYGAGCVPPNLTAARITGRVDGSSSVAMDSFDLKLESLSVDGVELAGSLTGGTQAADSGREVATGLSLTAGGSLGITGSVVVEWNEASSTFTFTEARLTFVDDALGTWEVTYLNAVVPYGETQSFRPTGGMATAESVPDGLGEQAQIVEFEFPQ